MTLEFNYMLELFTSLKSLVLEKTGNPSDYAGLFSLFDQNHDNLLDKNELRDMIVAAKKENSVTDAEVQFIFNVMSFFSKFLRK
jgi:Ca2+-binding EF-hand superfamily protein